MTATGEILGARMEAIDEALNALAADSDVPAEEYIEALESIAHRCQMAAHAVRLETGTNREWAEFVLALEQWLNNKPTIPDLHKQGIEMHVKLRQWQGRITGPEARKAGALMERLLIDVFGIDPEKVTKT